MIEVDPRVVWRCQVSSRAQRNAVSRRGGRTFREGPAGDGQVKISFRLDISTIASDPFLDTAVWALSEGLMTEDELMNVIADEILSNVKVVEE